MPSVILVVEDDPDIAESLRYNLERDGLVTIVAATGEKVWQQLLMHGPVRLL